MTGPTKIRAGRSDVYRLLAAWLRTLIPTAAFRLLPGSSRDWGPPRRTASVAAYARRHPFTWHPVQPAREDALPPPFTGPLPAASPLNVTSFRWEAKGIAILPGARVLADDAWVIGAEDSFLGEFHDTGPLRHSTAYLRGRRNPVTRLPGRTLNLGSAFAGGNFYHWMMDGVARADFFHRAGFSWADVDRVLIPRFHSETTRRVVAALGLPADRVVQPGRGDQFECEELWQPSPTGARRLTAPWAVGFHRALLPPPPPSGRSTRVFLARRGARSLIGQDAFASRLAREGFETLDAGDFDHLRDRLANATHVVGVHGAALTNLLYCHPGTRVLELLSDDSPWPHYRSLCAGAGLPYGAVIGVARSRRLHPAIPRNGDFQIKPAAFESGLARLLA
jgi:capsular polysaccharide biosynthesis protein